MKSRERLIKLINGERIDRVPVVPFIYNNFINEFYKSNEVDPVKKGIEVYKYFGFDIILRTCNVYDYTSEVPCDSTNWRVTETRQDEGNQWNITTVIKTPEKTLKQIKKFCKVTNYETVQAIMEYYIKDDSDFDQFVKYQPPVPKYDCSIITRARELLGDDGLAAPWAQGAFNSVCLYRKLDDLLIDPYLDIDFYNKMMAYFADRMLDTIKQFATAGADIICCAGNIGNATMVGPNFFKEHILPFEIKFTKKVKDFGVYYLYHNCGDAASLLDFYSQIKMDIYESLTASPYGDTVLDDALIRIDNKIALIGNIDQITFLKTASEEEIWLEVKNVLERTKSRGNFILGTTDFLSEGTPYNKIHAFAKAGIEFGRF